MAFALNFDQKVKNTLEGMPLLRQYKWVTGWCADERSKVDIAGLKNGIVRVLVEIELKKDNPVENVVKVWRWAARRRNNNKVLFVHAFSAHYLDTGSTSPPTKIKQHERAVFIGQQMKKNRTLRVNYKTLPIRTTTRNGELKYFKPLMRRGVIVKAGGGAMLRAADNLAHGIANLLRSET